MRFRFDPNQEYQLEAIRAVGGYGGGRHVAAEQAREAVNDARDILAAVSELNPHEFHMPEPRPDG